MDKRQIPDGLHDKGKKKGAVVAALVAGLVLLVIVIGAVIGRYQRQFSSDHSVKARKFYFTSNFLDGTSHTLAPESTSVTFTLGNHADNLRYSEVDINYEVTVTDVDGNGAGVEISSATGILGKSTKSDADVTISGLQAGNTYTVTATGTGGYSETLTATIVIPKEVEKLYQYQESIPGEYLLLTVWNEGDADGKVTITYTGIPDNTNPNMKDWITNEGDQEVMKVIIIGSHESKVFRFFGETTITVTGATSKEPQ